MTDREYKAREVKREDTFVGHQPRASWTYQNLAERMLNESGEARTDRWHVLTHKTTCRFLKDTENVIGLELHATMIAKMFFDGSVQVFTGGFRTQTTQRRLNAVLGPIGYLVVIRRAHWYIMNVEEQTTRDFAEGMVVFPWHPQDPAQA